MHIRIKQPSAIPDIAIGPGGPTYRGSRQFVAPRFVPAYRKHAIVPSAGNLVLLPSYYQRTAGISLMKVF